jgi:hypothetical protein
VGREEIGSNFEADLIVPLAILPGLFLELSYGYSREIGNEGDVVVAAWKSVSRYSNIA